MTDQFSKTAASNGAVRKAKLNVFISYSRQDVVFVDRLQTALASHDIEAFVDRGHIEKGEEWWARIKQLITEADTIVFVLSPSSVGSEVCADEVAFAEHLNKRFVPIVARDLEGRSVPAALSRLNYIFFPFYPTSAAGGDFEAAVSDLVRVLETDISWIREHTRLGAVAERWETRQRPNDLLLRGAELNAAEKWLTTRPEKAPDPTDAHRALVTLSRQASTRRQRILIGAAVSALVASSALASVAVWQRGVAIENEARAVAEARRAEREADRATRSEAQTRRVTDQAQYTESGLLANAAGQLYDLGDFGSAILVSLEGLPDLRSEDPAVQRRSYASESELQLHRSLMRMREQAVMAGHTDTINAAALSWDGARVVSGSLDATARVFDAVTGKVLALLQGHTELIRRVAFSMDGTRVVTASNDGSVRIWDAATGKEVARLEELNHFYDEARFSADGTRVLTVTNNGKPQIWDATTGKALFNLTGPSGQASERATFSADGAWAITASQDGSAGTWNAWTGQKIATLDGRVASLADAAFSADGKLLVTSSEYEQARVWDAVTGREIAALKELKGCTGRSHGAAFGPHGKRVFLVFYDHVCVWDAATGQEMAQITGRGGSISGDGVRATTISANNTIHIWDTATARAIARFEGHGSWVSQTAMNASTGTILTTSMDGTARIWNTARRSELARLAGHSSPIDLVSFSVDSSRILTMSGRQAPRLWDASTGKDVASLDAHTDRVDSVEFSPNGSKVVTTSADKTARVWNAMTGKELVSLLGHDREVYGAAFSADGTRVATISADGTTRVWDAATGTQLALFKEPSSGGLARVSFSADGSRVVTEALSEMTRVWDIATGKQVAFLQGSNPKFSSDGSRMTTHVSFEHTMKLWDLATGKEMAKLSGHEATFSRDGTLVVFASDRAAHVWKAATAEEMVRLEHGGRVNTAIFSADASRVLTASVDQTASVWEATTGKEIMRFEGHVISATSAAFSANETRVMTSDGNNTVRLWDLATGKEIVRIEHQASDGQASLSASVAVSPDGRRIVTTRSEGDDDRTAHLWWVHTSTDELVQAAKSRVPRCLTQAQRVQYFLPEVPPSWCVEQRLWPYQGEQWQEWLLKRKAWVVTREGPEPELPR